jgi:hypothetical protein
VVPTFVAAGLPDVSLAPGTVISAAYDVRTVNVSALDFALLTFRYFSTNDLPPTLTFFNQKTGKQASPGPVFTVSTQVFVPAPSSSPSDLPTQSSPEGEAFLVTSNTTLVSATLQAEGDSGASDGSGGAAPEAEDGSTRAAETLGRELPTSSQGVVDLPPLTLTPSSPNPPLFEDSPRDPTKGPKELAPREEEKADSRNESTADNVEEERPEEEHRTDPSSGQASELDTALGGFEADTDFDQQDALLLAALALLAGTTDSPGRRRGS